jgi:membrane protease YdiL (CAAX protease family)
MGAIIVGACVLAPLWEEFLFRGHLQSLILRFMLYLSRSGRGNTDTIPIADIAQPDAPLGYETTGHTPRPAWTSWLAILITSLLFASIHPTWSFPIIFALSICLGYAYERTGNLWVSITMHAMFNTASTALFLAGAGSH